VNVNVKDAFGHWYVVPLTLAQINSALGLGMGASYPNSAAVGNDLVSGGGQDSPSLMHRTAGSAGFFLYTVEYAIIRKEPPPFFSEIWLFASGSNIDMEHALSLTYKSWEGAGCTWPEAYTYILDPDQHVYNLTATDYQSGSPFDCFLTIQ
jgi:hypothetical protein